MATLKLPQAEKAKDVLARLDSLRSDLEREAIKAGVSEEFLGMWRRGRLSNDALRKLIPAE